MACACSSACRWRSRRRTATDAISPPSGTSSVTCSPRSPTDMAGRAPRSALTPPARGVSRGRFAVVAGRFNEAITKKLLDGAVGALAAHGVTGSLLEVHWVPGSFELAQAGCARAATGGYAGIVW